MLVNELPSTFLVGGVHDRSSTPLVAAAQALSPRKGTSSAPRASRTKDLFTMSRAGSSVQTLVPKGGLEPPRVAPHAPQTCASASSATSARCEAEVYRYRRRLTIRPTLWRSLGSSASRIPSPRWLYDRTVMRIARPW